MRLQLAMYEMHVPTCRIWLGNSRTGLDNNGIQFRACNPQSGICKFYRDNSKPQFGAREFEFHCFFFLVRCIIIRIFMNKVTKTTLLKLFFSGIKQFPLFFLSFLWCIIIKSFVNNVLRNTIFFHLLKKFQIPIITTSFNVAY